MRAVVVISSFVAGALAIAMAAGPARAEPRPWAPLRFGASGVVAGPLAGELILTGVDLHVLQQAGTATMGADGHGHGPFAGIGGSAGLATFSAGQDGTCADAVDEDGDTRWTCGQLTIGPTAMLGWAWGTALESGFARQDRLVFVRATPHFALVKNPERRTAEVGLATAFGVGFRPFMFEATWIKVPGDSYVGVTLGLSASVSGWLVNDRPTAAAIATDEAAAAAAAARPPSHWRVDLLGSGLVPVASVDGEPLTGAADVGVARVSGFPDEASHHWHRFRAIGGVLRALGSGQGRGDSAVQLGPTLTIGSARFDGEHPLTSLYAKASAVIGWRSQAGDDSLDAGGWLALGTTLGAPEHLDDDDELSGPSDTGALGFGLELTAGWMRGAAYLGGGVGLVFW
jgi:hypothetical protein